MKQMPALGAKYVADFTATLDLVAATETLWLQAPPASLIKQQLKVQQMEALYEAFFLRIFAAYENFLEDVLSRYMAGYESSLYRPTPVPGKRLEPTITAALATLYGPKPFLLWHGVSSVVARSQAHLVACPVESVLQAHQKNLEDYASIRHRIAHSSSDAAAKFAKASTRLTGKTFDRPGRLLRAPDANALNPSKWILRIVNDLSHVVVSICP